MARIPLFLLHTVLFPGARLPLKVFEPRYLDMVSACLREERPFGVCLLRSGNEVGEVGVPHPVGTLARIEQWEMPTPGILHVQVQGVERFTVGDREVHNQLLVADIELWEPEPPLEIPARYARLTEFLKEVLAHEDEDLSDADFEDASWVGMRLAELLPLDSRVKQEWLAQRDPVARLGAILAALKEFAHDSEEE
jgi:Lon protease-like protein